MVAVPSVHADRSDQIIGNRAGDRADRLPLTLPTGAVGILGEVTAAGRRGDSSSSRCSSAWSPSAAGLSSAPSSWRGPTARRRCGGCSRSVQLHRGLLHRQEGPGGAGRARAAGLPAVVVGSRVRLVRLPDPVPVPRRGRLRRRRGGHPLWTAHWIMTSRVQHTLGNLMPLPRFDRLPRRVAGARSSPSRGPTSPGTGRTRPRSTRSSPTPASPQDLGLPLLRRQGRPVVGRRRRRRRTGPGSAGAVAAGRVGARTSGSSSGRVRPACRPTCATAPTTGPCWRRAATPRSGGWIADLVADGTRIGVIDAVPGIEGRHGGRVRGPGPLGPDRPSEPGRHRAPPHPCSPACGAPPPR